MGCSTCGGSSYSSSYSRTVSSNGTTTTTSSSTTRSSTSSVNNTSLTGATFGSYRVKNGYNGDYARKDTPFVNKLAGKRRSRADETMNLSMAEQAYLELNKKYMR